MSADSWIFCPNCAKEEILEHEDILRKVNVDYGKVPKDEFLANLKEAEKAVKEKPEETLAQYLSVYISLEGNLMIDYKASCNRCNAHYKYQKKIPLQPTRRKKYE